MGKSADQKKNEQQQQRTVDLTSRLVNEKAFQPSPLTNQAQSITNDMWNNYTGAANQQRGDYTGLMGDYKNLYGEISGRSPMSFSWDKVNVERPEELNEAYGYLREAAPGYRDFANTGGYSTQDIQELRARGISPIRAAYGNTMRELNRARSLGGAGGAPNYIAARSRAQRELPQQIADATTNVNAGLADSIRQGKLAGLAGLSGIGSTMGGLSDSEAGRLLQANLANSQGSLQAAGMTANERNNWMGQRLSALGGASSLYGTTPGMASTFGNQALGAFGNQMGLEQMQNNFGLGLIDSNLRALQTRQQSQGQPWWKTALGIAGTAAPYVGMALSDKNAKDRVTPLNSKKVVKGLKKLSLNKWYYKGDDTPHFGPMAQDFKKHFGVGDGKTLHPADVMGVMLAASKEATANA